MALRGRTTNPVQKWLYLILKALPISVEQINHITISLGWTGIRIEPMQMQDFEFFWSPPSFLFSKSLHFHQQPLETEGLRLFFFQSYITA